MALGNKIESTVLDKVTIPVLTSHSTTLPYSFGTLSLYNQGFVVENMFHSNHIPLVISFERNVEAVWTVDCNECCKRALQSFNTTTANTTSGSMNMNDGVSINEMLPEGILLVIKLKNIQHPFFTPSTTTNNTSNTTTNPSVTTAADDVILDFYSLNMHKVVFPLAESDLLVSNEEGSTYIGLYMPADSRTASTLTTARQLWRKAMYQYDIPDYKFDSSTTTTAASNNKTKSNSNSKSSNSSSNVFPKSIYTSLLSLIDAYSYGILHHIAQICSYSIGVDLDVYTQSVMSITPTTAMNTTTAVGTGFYMMRYIFIVCNWR